MLSYTMKILGIETSCDETAAAVVEDGKRLLSNVVATQLDIHKVFGGVVPEIAARNHIEVITPVIQQALVEAKLTWDDIDAIGVTKGPGLSGSLLIGTLAARTLSLSKNKPLYGVNHVLAHAYVNFLLNPQPKFPILALIVSGGHSQVVFFKGHLSYQILGQTQDDAVGEAYDKVAKIIGLPYPGGPSIEKKSKQGNPSKYKFPKAKLQNKYDFSFSGPKTAVLRKAQKITGQDYSFPSHKLSELLDDTQVADIAASFQKVAVDTLVEKVEMAFKEYSPASVMIGGGVAANQALREELDSRIPIDIIYSPINLCTDNAAMVATLAYYQAETRSADSPFHLEISPSLSM